MWWKIGISRASLPVLSLWRRRASQEVRLANAKGKKGKPNASAAKPPPSTFRVALAATAKEEEDEARAQSFLLVAAKHLNSGDSPAPIDWEDAMKVIVETEKRYPLRYYDKEERIDAHERGLTFNLAKVVDDSPALTKLVDLGVNLSYWETKEGWMDLALRLEFWRDVAPVVRLLADHIQAGKSRPFTVSILLFPLR